MLLEPHCPLLQTWTELREPIHGDDGWAWKHVEIWFQILVTDDQLLVHLSSIIEIHLGFMSVLQLQLYF